MNIVIEHLSADSTFLKRLMNTHVWLMWQMQTSLSLKYEQRRMYNLDFREIFAENTSLRGRQECSSKSNCLPTLSHNFPFCYLMNVRAQVPRMYLTIKAVKLITAMFSLLWALYS